MNINEIKNSMIPRKVKEICWKCESNIHCRNKGCAFRSLGNEYCDEVLLATQEYLEKDQEIERLNNMINKCQDIIFNSAFKFDKWVENENGKCILSQSVYKIDNLSQKKVEEIWDILKGSDKKC